MLTGINQQIVTAYETLGLTISQIQEAFQELALDSLAIKATLMQFSEKYRNDNKKVVNNDFNDDELIEANQVMVSLMRGADDEHLRARMARYIRDDKKGRLDVHGIRDINVNVMMFNERLLKAREAKMLSKGAPNPPLSPPPFQEKVIDVTEVENSEELVEH